MRSTVVIVESPSKCAKIESFLGPDYRCIATCGHIRVLDGLESIDIGKGFIPSFKNAPGKSVQIQTLIRSVSTAKRVVLASDEDREGEAIAWHICQVCGLDVTSTDRITFNEITKQAVTRALANPRRVDLQLVQAQQTRQVLDLLVGFRVSPSLWDNISADRKGKSLSAGRCQSPALRIVFDNDNDIANSPGNLTYKITGIFENLKCPLILDTQFDEGEKARSFLSSSIDHRHMLKIGSERTTTAAPPLPFTTSSLQQKASSELRMSPKTTDEICQRLYNAGRITYIRTDRSQYADEFLKTMEEFLKQHYHSMTMFTAHHKVESIESAQEAHEAIRPTKLDDEGLDLDRNDLKLYSLIRNYTIASCLPPATGVSKTLAMSSPLQKHSYRVVVRKGINPGWRSALGYKEESSDYDKLKYLSTKKEFKVVSLTASLILKDQKLHLTEAKLVKELEERGIGRPSTFSSLVSKIIDRGYVIKSNIKGRTIQAEEYKLVDKKVVTLPLSKTLGAESQKLVITDVGKEVMSFLLTYYKQLFSYDYTKRLESKLDEIARGESTRKRVCEECLQVIEDCMKQIPQTRTILDAHHTYMIGRFGPVVKYTKDGVTRFIGVNTEIDPKKVAEGTIKISDLLKEKKNGNTGDEIGTHEGKQVYIKDGQFGKYILWGKTTITLPQDITEPYSLEQLKPLLINPVIRQINTNISLRRGRHGQYFYYKTNRMKKPKFIKTTAAINGSSSNSDIVKWVKANCKK